jgi:hypothetical protein
MANRYLVTLVRTVTSTAVVNVFSENKDDAETEAFVEATGDGADWEESDYSCSVYQVEELTE